MTPTRFLRGLAALALGTAATAALANDNATGETRAASALTVAMSDSVAQPQGSRHELRSYSHGRNAAPHTPRSEAPVVAAERPPRLPVALAKTTDRPKAAASRLGAGHPFSPRGFPKW